MLSKFKLPFLILTFTTLLLVTATLPSQKAKAAVGYKDQYNETVSPSSGAVTISNYGHKQTFKPSYPKLVGVYVYLRDAVAGNSLTLRVTHEDTVSPTVEQTVRMNGGTGWQEFTFNAKSVLVDEEYTIHLETGGTTTKWSYEDGNPYARGLRMQNSTPYPDLDHGFITWGENLPSPTDTPTEETTETPTQTPTEEEKEEKEEDKDQKAYTLKDPELTEVIKNDSSVELPLTEALSVTSSDDLQLKGTAPKDSTVLVYLGDAIYYVTTENGQWSVTPTMQGLTAGTHTITAQVQNAEAAQSQMVDLLDIEYTPSEETSDASTTEESSTSFWSRYKWWIMGGLVLLLASSGTGYYFWKKRKNEKSETKKESQDKKPKVKNRT